MRGTRVQVSSSRQARSRQKVRVGAKLLVTLLAIMAIFLLSMEPAAIEDFESYDDDENRIYDTWIDGFTNETSATVGWFEAPFAERQTVHRGRQSMPLEYDNAAAPYYSETSRTWAYSQNWTARGADALTLYLKGTNDNPTEPLSVGLKDKAERFAFAAHPDPNILVASRWTRWTIPLRDFAHIDVTGVKAMHIRIGDPSQVQGL